MFVSSSETITPLAEITVEISDKSVSEDAVTLTLQAKADGATLEPNNVSFIQTEALTSAGIAVHPFGALLIPATQATTEMALECEINGVKYTNAETKVTSANNVGDTVKLTKV